MQKWAEHFYKSTGWKKTRYSYLVSKDFTCERCGARATMVHHRTYLTEQLINNPALTVGYENLEALCETCHDVEHKADSPLRKGMYFDGEGMLCFAEEDDAREAAEAPYPGSK